MGSSAKRKKEKQKDFQVRITAFGHRKRVLTTCAESEAQGREDQSEDR
jgi:hypothetical protein